MPRHFLSIPDFTKPELDRLFELAESMRSGAYTKKPLAGKSLAMIFLKSSTRTRVSFEVGASQLGGHGLFLSSRDVQMGRGEPIPDTARVLSRYVDGIMIRTFAHSDVEQLAQYSRVPVINGLTDLLHPCQVLADLLTMRQQLGTYQLGGHALFLSPRDVQLGRGEPIADTARVLSRYVDGIMIRTFAHQDVEELARYASVPVINGLTDMLHPCQILADLLTVRQHLGGIEGKTVAWIGDGNNMANSWINAAYRFGFDLRIACPEGYEPADHLLERARKEANIVLTRDPKEAIQGADVVNTDVWASMGQEGEQKKRERDFAGYTVDRGMMARAASDAIFLHCLPAHRGEEVTADVIDGPQSRVWDEAENRLHIQKAIMAVLMGGESLT